MAGLEPMIWVLAAGITVLAGFVKGVVGFAMPLIMISGIASFLPVETALGALILPTLVSNGIQLLRDGPAAALASARRFWVFIAVGVAAIFLSAPLVRVLPGAVLLGVVGFVALGFVAFQLAGWRLRVPPGSERRAEIGLGLASGAIGGVSGVWGPPTVMLLTALDVPKREHIRVQGAIYSVSALALAVAHLRSGVLNASTAVLSLTMIAPALAGMWVGLRVQDRLDADLFRKATLVALALTGANLLRRGVAG